jgi:hypothetical protein
MIVLQLSRRSALWNWRMLALQRWTLHPCSRWHKLGLLLEVNVKPSNPIPSPSNRIRGLRSASALLSLLRRPHLLLESLEPCPQTSPRQRLTSSPEYLGSGRQTIVLYRLGSALLSKAAVPPHSTTTACLQRNPCERPASIASH